MGGIYDTRRVSHPTLRRLVVEFYGPTGPEGSPTFPVWTSSSQLRLRLYNGTCVQSQRSIHYHVALHPLCVHVLLLEFWHIHGHLACGSSLDSTASVFGSVHGRGLRPTLAYFTGCGYRCCSSSRGRCHHPGDLGKCGLPRCILHQQCWLALWLPRVSGRAFTPYALWVVVLPFICRTHLDSERIC